MPADVEKLIEHIRSRSDVDKGSAIAILKSKGVLKQKGKHLVRAKKRHRSKSKKRMGY